MVIYEAPETGQIKEHNNPNDLVKLQFAFKEAGNFTEAVQITNTNLQEVLNDPAIIKRYVSEALMEDFDIFSLAKLGIEYLHMACDMDGHEEARQIYYKAFKKTLNKVFADHEKD